MLPISTCIYLPSEIPDFEDNENYFDMIGILSTSSSWIIRGILENEIRTLKPLN